MQLTESRRKRLQTKSIVQWFSLLASGGEDSRYANRFSQASELGLDLGLIVGNLSLLRLRVFDEGRQLLLLF